MDNCKGDKIQFFLISYLIFSTHDIIVLAQASRLCPPNKIFNI